VKKPFIQLYVHLVWATWNRMPLLTDDLRNRIYGVVRSKCESLKCDLLAVGGIEDHVHALIRLHPTVAVADLAKEIKGASSHFVTHIAAPGDFFKWQGSYGAFTIRIDEVERVKAYIHDQPAHHASANLMPLYEQVEQDDPPAGAGRVSGELDLSLMARVYAGEPSEGGVSLAFLFPVSTGSQNNTCFIP
jgi:putative transposase